MVYPNSKLSRSRLKESLDSLLLQRSARISELEKDLADVNSARSSDTQAHEKQYNTLNQVVSSALLTPLLKVLFWFLFSKKTRLQG